MTSWSGVQYIKLIQSFLDDFYVPLILVIWVMNIAVPRTVARHRSSKNALGIGFPVL
jgi:hypothetical protein